jgi:hypothetical protein
MNVAGAEARADFESTFKTYLKEFDKFRLSQKTQELRMEYFNDKVDRLVNDTLSYIKSKKIVEIHPEISSLENTLQTVPEKCGSTTEKVVKKVKIEIKNNITKQKIRSWIEQLEASFTKKEMQEKLPSKKDSVFAIGFIEG